MSDIKRLRVFLSAPGDVLAARAVVRDLVGKLATDFKPRNVHLTIASWDDPDDLQSLDAHLTPQQAHAHGRPLPAECEVVVTILWSRMGTPLPHDGEAYLSATHFEFESAIRAKHPPRMLVYRWTAPPEQAWVDFATGESPEQRQQQFGAIEQFVAGIGSAAIPITPFASIAEFEKLLLAQLAGALTEALEPRPASTPATSNAESSSAPPIIFLSAVSDEFRSYREHLKRSLEHAAQVPTIIQEYFDAVGQGTLGGLDARVRRCSAVVHLLGDMAGYFPPPNAVRELVQRHPKLTTLLGLDADALLEPVNAISYTQWEADLAILHGKQLFLAEAARDAQREPASYRRDPAQLASQQTHRERLRTLMDRWHELQFNGPDDIASKLLPALSAQHPRHFSGASIYSLGARRFDEYYLKASTKDGQEVPAPFGGRRREMERLDLWLDDPARDPRLLVSSPAGRGKSALLAQWMKALRDDKRVGPDGWQLVFVPISNRFQTNRATTYLELLVRQLAQVAGEYVPPPSIDAEPFYRNKANKLISGLVGAGRRVLLVIDGLDEALGDERLTDLLPVTLSATFRVLASARWMLDDHDGSGWLSRLHWTSAGRPADHDLVVEKLDADAIEDVLISMGAPIEPVGRGRPLVTRLTALTEGEPLLLRFYAEDLWLKTTASSPITLDVLDNMQPGFGPYFKTWLQDQGGVAANATRKPDPLDAAGQIDPRTIHPTLAILGFAKAGLTGKELVAIAEAGFPKLPWWTVARPHLAPFQRFVIGDGSDEFRYTFSHPKVAEFIKTDECKELADQTAIAFFVWGRHQVARLNVIDGADRLRPEQASRYALEHYAHHLKDVGDTATAEDYMTMVEDGWRRAKEWHDSGPAGFADDVQAAWNACRDVGDVAHLGAQWRCALTLSSIKSVGTNIPHSLLVGLVKDGTLSPQQARHFCVQEGPTEDAVGGLVDIACAIADNLPAAAAMTDAAIDLAVSARDERSRVRAILRVLNGLHSKLGGTFTQAVDATRYGEALAAALSAAKAIADEQERSLAIAALAPHLDPIRRQAVIAEALVATKVIGDEWSRSDALAELSPYLDPLQLQDALDSAKTIGNEWHRSLALAALAPNLDPAQRTDALAAAIAIGDEGHRSAAIVGLATHLNSAQRIEALAAVRSICQEGARSEALIALAPFLDPQQCAEAVVIAKSIREDRNRSMALAALVPWLDPSERQHVLAEALAAMKRTDDRPGRSQVLAALGPHLNSVQREAMLAEALAAARAIDIEVPRSRILDTLFPYLDPNQRQTVLAVALATAKSIGHEAARCKALAALANHHDPIHRQAVLVTPASASEGDLRAG